MSTVHELKTWPKFFQAVKRGDKPFECRKNDRGFREGDFLHLREWKPAMPSDERGAIVGYTGSELMCRVTYVLRDCVCEGVCMGYAVLGIKVLS